MLCSCANVLQSSSKTDSLLLSAMINQLVEMMPKTYPIKSAMVQLHRQRAHVGVNVIRHKVGNIVHSTLPVEQILL